MLKKSLYVTLIAVFACWMVLGTIHLSTQAAPPPMAQPFPTFSCSASAGRMGCSSSATPGIGNYNSVTSGGWTGTASANAGVGGGDSTGPTDKAIEAYIFNSYVEAGLTISGGSSSAPSIGIGITIGSNFNEVRVTDASESRFGTPFQDKWASSSGCFAEIWDDAYDDYDGWL